MTILDGSSNKNDARQAIDEATDHWHKNFSPDILFVFHSTRQDSTAVASEQAKRFPDSIIAGSTTAGEWINNTHQHHTLILLALSIPELRWSVAVAEQLDKDLDALVFSNHPLIYQHQHECYVRSIAQVGEDHSLVFYCAIEEGMILNLCSHQDMGSSNSNRYLMT